MFGKQGKRDRKDMSFLPEDYLEKRAQRRTNFISIVLFVVVMGGVIGAYMVTNEKRDNVRRRLAQVNEEYRTRYEQLAQLKQLQASKDQMIRKAKVTSVLIEPVPRTIILSEMTNKMPRTLSLLEMEMETKVLHRPRPATKLERAKQRKQAKADGEEMPETPPTEVRVDLTGVAPTDLEVSEFMTALKLCELFGQVNLVTSEETVIENEKMRRFRLEFVVNQDINLHDYEPTRVKRDLKFDPMGERVTVDGVVPSEVITPDGVLDEDHPSFREDE